MEDHMPESMFVYEVDEKSRIATITFNKPHKLNCLSLPEMQELADLLQKPQDDDRVKVIIFRGAGKAFCSGADVSQLSSDQGFGSRDAKGKYKRPSQHLKLRIDDKTTFGLRGLMQSILGCNKATIAQVHGYAYGGGFVITVACDITIAAEGTLFTHAGYRLMGPSAEGSAIPLIMTIGPKKAMEMMLTGRPIEAKEAERIGIINKVVPPDQLEAEVQRYAKTIALLSLEGIVMGKYATRCALERFGYFGYMPVVLHNLGTNIVWEEGDFNWYKENRDQGASAAIKEREKRYAELGMDMESAKKVADINP
jgi:enoyl-CoA hydratase/carnithine racemase